MRILADENFPGDIIETLRIQGYDVLWIRTDAPGISDRAILAFAQIEQRVIVTFDKDFGELAFHLGLPATCGIILFRLPPFSPARLTEIVLGVLGSRNDWQGFFTVVEPERIRMRPLLNNSE